MTDNRPEPSGFLGVAAFLLLATGALLSSWEPSWPLRLSSALLVPVAAAIVLVSLTLAVLASQRAMSRGALFLAGVLVVLCGAMLEFSFDWSAGEISGPIKSAFPHSAGLLDKLWFFCVMGSKVVNFGIAALGANICAHALLKHR